MASVTTFVVIGEPHQNDTGLNPEILVELWEGSRARWIFRKMSDGTVLKTIEPSSPKDIAKELVREIEALEPGATDTAGKPLLLSVVVTALEGSTVLHQLDDLKSLIACDLHVLTTTYSRMFSPWAKSWVVTDNSPQSEASAQ
jgi:hypothetical protein